MYKSMFYITSTTIGYYVVKDLPGLPPMMFGNGNMRWLFDGFPNWDMPDKLRSFYLVSIGYHVDGFFFHLFGPRNNDYVEMVLHHSATISLLYFSHMLQCQHIGVLVYWLHDWADIPGCLCRAVLDL